VTIHQAFDVRLPVLSPLLERDLLDDSRFLDPGAEVERIFWKEPDLTL